MSKTVDHKRLRSGFTTGACAAAAARGAAGMLIGGRPLESVDIPMPPEAGLEGNRATFKLTQTSINQYNAYAAVKKNAGDDPDVTNGILIAAIARFTDSIDGGVSVKGGKGVGTVTLPGLPVPVGQPAINPVPMKMIKDAVAEVLAETGGMRSIEIEIIVPKGEEVAERTLNGRLGIKGGISILGTTGIVKPLSAEAWQATVTSSMDVARATGHTEVILSSGRTSERAAMEFFGLPEEVCAMMGDHVEFSFIEAGKRGFKRIIIAAQWAKLIKIAMGTPDTHVRAGALSPSDAADFLREMGIVLPEGQYNTARQMLEHIGDNEDILKVCRRAAQYGRQISGIETVAAFVSYDGKVQVTSG